MERRIRLVDVFGEQPLTGNPLAVVVDADDLTTEDMLDLTRWIGFSETTFLFPPQTAEADYRVRIFTLAGELPFAGHPTLGTCHVWQRHTGESKEQLIQECGAGLVRLQRSGETISFGAPPLIRNGPIEQAKLEEVALVLGVDFSDITAARWVDNGPGWLGVTLENPEAVLALAPDFARRRGTDKLDIGVVGMYPEGSELRYEVRAFFSGERGEMIEDPVTGSLNASLAQWLISDGVVTPPYVASQGTALGRKGRVQITSDAGSVWVGGRVFDVVDGRFDLYT